MSNTVIQLKYSLATASPTTLEVGEAAYSFNSNKLFIGNSTNHVLTIGGKYYVDQIEAATDSSTGSTLVKRDASGNASFNYVYANIVGTITGNADSATKLQTARFFNFSGDIDSTSVSFDGTGNADFTLELTNTGVTSGTYGGSTNIPVITVDEDGRITSASNTSISTDLNIKADTGSNVISLATDSLTFVGGDGITTSIDPTDNVTFAVDETVIRTTGGQTIGGDLNVSGNLTVSGNTAYINVTNYRVEDTIIYLGANNYTSDIEDIGFAANYYDGATQRHAGFIRKAATNDFYAFTNYDEEFDSNTLNIANPSLVFANVHANLKNGSIYNATIDSLASDLAVKDGGTGAGSFTEGSILIGNGTGALQTLANTSSAGTYANATHVPVITVDSYGRVSSVTNTAIAVDASQVSTGILALARGGTNNDTYTVGGLLVSNGTSIVSISNSSFTQTGTLTTANTVTSVSVDSYGRLTALTSSAIAIDAGQITTGTLGVNRGGTGAGTFTTNGVLLGNGTGAFNTASSSTEGHVLTINGSGVPTFAMLSGGTF